MDDDEEAAEKLGLSISCVHFLKYASISQDLKHLLAGRREKFKRILHAEEIYTYESHRKIPIEVEMTEIGRNFQELRHALTGAESVQPYTYVSIRVIQRIADILQARPEPDIHDPFVPGMDTVESLKAGLYENFHSKIVFEQEVWQDNMDRLEQVLTSKQEVVQHFTIQHTQFSKHNGIFLLKLFLTGLKKQNEEILQAEYDPTYAKLELLDQMTLKTLQAEAKEKERQYRARQNKEASYKPVTLTSQSEDKRRIELLRTALQEENASCSGLGFDDNSLTIVG